MPSAQPVPRRGLAAALALASLALASLAACGGDPPPPALRVSEQAPLPASGADEQPVPEPAGEPAGAVAPGGLATFVAALPGRTVVAPRPGLAAPSPKGAAPEGVAPKLTGRTAD